MKTKRLILTLTIVSLLMAVPAFALLAAPTNLTVDVDNGAETVDFDWDPVTGAVKYSVDVEGTVTYYDDSAAVEVEAEVEVSFGTSDRTDGGLMGDDDLTITFEELADAIADELGLAPEDDLISLEDATAKVKALDPGKNKGRQNNPFSDPPTDFDEDVTF